MASSSNRITGLATGLDIDSIVEASLAAQKNKITKKTQAKEILEIKQQLYRDIISEGRNLYDKYFDVAKSGSMLNSALYTSVKCTSSNENSITATPGAEAVKGNYTVTVNSSGSKAKMELTGDQLEDNLKITIGSGDKAVNVIIQKAELEGKTDKDKAALINSKISSYGLSAYTTDFSAGKIVISANEFGSEKDFTITKGTYNPEELTGSTNQSLNEVDGYSIASLNISDLLKDDAKDMEFKYGENIVRIKASSIKSAANGIEDEEEKAKAIQSFINDRLSSVGLNVDFTKDNDGNITDYSKINIRVLENDTLTEDDKKFTLNLGTIKDADVIGSEIEKNASNYVSGSKASVTVTGPRGSKEITDADSKFKLDGITFDISSAKAGDVATINAKTDVSTAKEKIVNFVNDYNTFIEKLNTLLTEKKYRDYAPLTEEQKKEMTDKEIELWEKKVKSGQLRNDSDLTRIANDMKNAMSNSIEGTSLFLENIGIKVSSDYGSAKSGTYTIDEDKLTRALENDMEGVMNLFIKKPDSTASDSDKYNQQGIAYRLKDILYTEFQYSSRSQLIQKAGYTGTRYFTQNTISNEISKYETLIDQLEDQLNEKEQKLYSKWATIETTMNNYNSQMSYLSSMFGGTSS